MEVSLTDIIDFLTPNDGDHIRLGNVEFANRRQTRVHSVPASRWNIAAIANDAQRLIAMRTEEFIEFVQARNDKRLRGHGTATSASTPPTRRTLEEIYRALPEVHCKGLCQACCGAIGMSEAEATIIYTKHGELPVLNEETCSMLGTDGRCTIYEDRPLICRAWGAAKSMPCPHGCGPVDLLSADQMANLIHETKLVTGRDELYFSAAARFITMEELADYRDHLRATMSPEDIKRYEE